MSLHTVPREVISTSFFWLGGQEICPICGQRGYDSHHHCARQFFGLSEGHERVYYCVCMTCRGYDALVRNYHYFIATDGMVCKECVNNKHPRRKS